MARKEKNISREMRQGLYAMVHSFATIHRANQYIRFKAAYTADQREDDTDGPNKTPPHIEG